MKNIHQTAIVAPGAQLGNDVTIGPYAIIGENVVIGDGSFVGPHAVIDGDTTIGKGCHIFPGAMIGQITQDLKYHGEKTYIRIGDGTTIREYVTVNGGTGDESDTTIGEKCHIMAYVHIAHNCHVGNNVIIANCGTLAGFVDVEDGAVIGGLVGIHQFCRIGRFSIIGGCSKVVQDCPPFLMIDGHPAKARALNKIGLQRRGFSADTMNSLKKAFKILYRSGYSTKHAVEQIRETLPAEDAYIREFSDFVVASTRGIC